MLRAAECIVMVLGQIAVAMCRDRPSVVATVVVVFQQRLFHPSSSLDNNVIIELGKLAARTGVRERGDRTCLLTHVCCMCISVCMCVCLRAYVHACVRTCVHVCVRACVRACCVSECMCVHVCIYMYIHVLCIYLCVLLDIHVYIVLSISNTDASAWSRVHV